MKTPMYLYSVNRKEVAPSLMAAWRSAAFCTICGHIRQAVRLLGPDAGR